MRRLVPYLVCLAIGLCFAWLLEINPEKEYGWFMGWVQGTLIIPNWIISLFDSNWLVKAPLHTTAYNIFWWFEVIMMVAGWGIGVLGAIMKMIAGKN